ncbi:hypothetical protein AGMMS50293_08370 [Spirochaetia bacterium]|nr:hypothetical protein AGMMS50293_08370 [Spirochaetia bacterium]
MALTEMDASDLILEAPVLGSSVGRVGSVEDIRLRLNDEYSLLGRNIRNLFEAIRVGSVPPAESAGYVEHIVELAERGRDRLTAALVSQNEAGSVQVARAAGAFGSFWEAADLRGQLPDSPWYSKPLPDSDGKLRRIAPLITPLPAPATAVEHIVYQSLKSRWADSEIETTEQGPVLVIRYAGDSGNELRIPLDRDGNILIEAAQGGELLRRLGIERFREYEEADRAMRRLLSGAETLGVYSKTRPEQIPLFLCDFAAALREELLKAPNPEKRAAWIVARAEYMGSLEEFLYGPAEMTLVGGYEEILATEKLKDEGRAKLLNLRDELIRAFAELREKYRELVETRNVLSEALVSSYCIMGPELADGTAESSAFFANALLTGSYINPGQNRYVLFWSLIAVFIILLCIHAMRPAALFISGTITALICAGAFGWSFIISAYWIDPLIPAVSSIAGMLFIFFTRLALIRRGARSFHFAYRPAVSRPILKKLIRAGRPLLHETITARAAIIAVRDSSLPGKEDREDPLKAAKAAAEFRAAVTEPFKKAGAVILAYEHETVLACFGSPPERIYLDKTKNETRYGDDPKAHSNHHPAIKACGFITELLTARNPEQHKIDWHFGIDCGDCAFSWSEETGYTANGRPVVRARILSSLASRYHAQILITDSVREILNQPARKLNTLGQGGGNVENFYELLLKST